MRRANGWFDRILHAGSRTTYHGKIRSRSTGKPRVTISRGKQRSYKGVQIIPVEGGEYTISIDRDSRFESVRDAKKVIDHMKGNPGEGYIVGGSHFIKDSAFAKRMARKWSDETRQPVRVTTLDGRLVYTAKPVSVKRNPRGSKGTFERCVKSVAQRGNPGKEVRVYPSERFKGKWSVAKVGGVVQTRKSKRGAISWAKRMMEPGDQLIVRDNPAAGAIAVSEEFHGRKVGKMVPVKEQRHHHAYLADLGELRKLVVLTCDGKGKVTLTGFKGAMLTCNEAKDQLFITGGDQQVNPKEFGIDRPHETETLGEVVTIEYFTDKRHLGDEGGTATYTHKFRSTNENGKHVTVRTARNPDLIYRKRDKRLEFSGGSYFIRKEGIDL